MIRFVAPGNPIPKERPRLGRRVYTPARTRKAEEDLRFWARNVTATKATGPIKVSLSFYRATAAPVDIDNLAKLVLDALNGICWQDDRQIVMLSLLKAVDRENPRTEVEIEEAYSDGA